MSISTKQNKTLELGKHASPNFIISVPLSISEWLLSLYRGNGEIRVEVWRVEMGRGTGICACWDAAGLKIKHFISPEITICWNGLGETDQRLLSLQLAYLEKV